MDQRAKTEFTFWLLPAEPRKSELRQIVHSLAREFDGPLFDPHITLYCGPSDAPEAAALAAKAAARFSPLTAEMASLAQSEDYSKTFFVQFRENEGIRSMFSFLRDMVTVPSSYSLNPHASLLYKEMPEAERVTLCRRPLFGDKTFVFDAIRAVEFDAPWSARSAVSCRSLGEFKLRNG